MKSMNFTNVELLLNKKKTSLLEKTGLNLDRESSIITI
jgi:hypothetical protein